MRVCSICGHEKPLDEFRYRGERSTGQPIYEYRCDYCRVMRQKIYRRRNRQRLNDYHRNYMAEIRTRPVLDEAFRKKNAERMRLARQKQRER